MTLNLSNALLALLAMGLGSMVSGCASFDDTASYEACPEGTERVRVGPRSQAPKYVCRTVD